MQLHLNFNPFPQLQTQRLILREPVPGDAAELHDLRSDDSVIEYLDRAKPASIDETTEFLNKVIINHTNGDGIMWIISRPDNTAVMGTIGFWRIDKQHFRAEIGYMLFPQYQRQGYMYEALKSVISFGFNTMNVHSVEANCNPENKASRHLLEKCSFVKEAHFKENYYYDGKFLDSVIYSLVSITAA
jgi:ribosomal-protein-alanine N-acetyltransferase